MAEKLEQSLSKLSDDWWGHYVYLQLSYQQQRIVDEQESQSLSDLDFAALLRVATKNWFELGFAKEGRNYVSELQTVRNKWAHMGSDEPTVSDVYRDLDTLHRFLEVIGAPNEILLELKEAKFMINNAGSSDGAHVPSSQTSGHTEQVAKMSDHTQFQVGDLVVVPTNSDSPMAVIGIDTDGAENQYSVLSNQSVVQFYESQLQPYVGNQVTAKSVSADSLRALLTGLIMTSSSTNALLSMREGRVNFVPYQYRPVIKLVKSDQPRLLIADEVGVGKTIEAGLIIKELKARLGIESILIICPKALVSERKWELEMKRFSEDFEPLDGEKFRFCLSEMHKDGEWPYKFQKAILPFSLFDERNVAGSTSSGMRSSVALADIDPAPHFDLVIVDEAHNIRNTETWLHRGVRYFCDHADATLLLSATPVQLGSEDLFTLLNVLRPDLVRDKASFSQMAEPNRFIGEAASACRRATDSWSAEAHASLVAAADTAWGRAIFRGDPEFQRLLDTLEEPEVPDEDRVTIIKQVEGLYTFGSMVNRTRRRDIGKFTVRKARTIEQPFTPIQQELHDRLLRVVASILEQVHGSQNIIFMMTTVRRQAASCIYGLAPMLEDMLSGKLTALEDFGFEDEPGPSEFSFLESVRSEISELVSISRDLDDSDPKVESFVQVILDKLSMNKNKALVFSTFRHTLKYLSEKLENERIRFAVIHGGVKDAERSEIRRRFGLEKENSDAIDILLSSEVGCEGLDFQFCDLIINYDLPWNPMRIEQRIGRIDRYGQESETVAIVNMVTPGTVDGDIYSRCLSRIGVFEESIGGTEVILGDIAREIAQIAESYNLTEEERNARLLQLADNSIRKVQEEEDLEEKQAHLVGLKIPKDQLQRDVEEADSPLLSAESIENLINVFLKSLVVESSAKESASIDSTRLRASKKAKSVLHDLLGKLRGTEAKAFEKWLKGDETSLLITFDQAAASENRALTYLSIGHPLVGLAASKLAQGNSVDAFLKVVSSSIEPGNYTFALCKWEKLGVRSEDTLFPISSDDAVSKCLVDLILKATNDGTPPLVSREEWKELDRIHYKQWVSARANHIEENRAQVDHKLQSLRASYEGQRGILTEQLNSATNEKIRRMRASQIARAEANFNDQSEKLKLVGENGDIHYHQIVRGHLRVINFERDENFS